MTRPLIPGSSDRVFSLTSDPRITVPSSAEVIYPAAFQNGQNGAAPMQMAAPPQGNGHAIPAAAPPAQAKANDPLAGLTAKQVYFDCVWLSKESTATKLMLVCIARFFDANARTSSMSYAQIARDCTLNERSAKRIAKDILGKWLTVGVQKGFKTESGKQNLYHGICPPDLVEELRELKRRGKAVEPDEAILAAADATVKGVSSGHPFNEQGVSSGHPSGQGVTSDPARGDITCPLTQINTDQKDSIGADAPDAGATEDDWFSGDASDQGGAPPKRPSPSTKGADCKPAPSTADIKLAFDLYLETAERCGLAKPKKVDPWAPNIKARLRESGLDGWKEVLAKVEASPFLRGERTKFRADLDWLSGPKNFAKVLSGKYDEAAPKHKPKPMSRY